MVQDRVQFRRLCFVSALPSLVHNEMKSFSNSTLLKCPQFALHLQLNCIHHIQISSSQLLATLLHLKLRHEQSNHCAHNSEKEENSTLARCHTYPQARPSWNNPLYCSKRTQRLYVKTRMQCALLNSLRMNQTSSYRD